MSRFPCRLLSARFDLNQCRNGQEISRKLSVALRKRRKGVTKQPSETTSREPVPNDVIRKQGNRAMQRVFSYAQ